MSYTSNDLGLYTASNERIRITSGGNVGIGTTSPSPSDTNAKTLQLGNNLILQNVVGSQVSLIS
jgi:hypothetical protein